MKDKRNTDYYASYDFLDRKYKEKLKLFEYKYKYQSWLAQVVGGVTYFFILAYILVSQNLNELENYRIQDLFERILTINLIVYPPLTLFVLIVSHCLQFIIIKKYLAKDYLNEDWILFFFLIQFIFGVLIIGLFSILLFLIIFF